MNKAIRQSIALLILNIITLVWCAYFAVMTGPSWLAMLDAFISGLTFAGAAYMFAWGKQQQQLHESDRLYRSMEAIVSALVDGRTMEGGKTSVVIDGEVRGSTTKPTKH